jgi:hypothetical protein
VRSCFDQLRSTDSRSSASAPRDGRRVMRPLRPFEARFRQAARPPLQEPARSCQARNTGPANVGAKYTLANRISTLPRLFAYFPPG